MIDDLKNILWRFRFELPDDRTRREIISHMERYLHAKCDEGVIHNFVVRDRTTPEIIDNNQGWIEVTTQANQNDLTFNVFDLMLNGDDCEIIEVGLMSEESIPRRKIKKHNFI